MLTKTQKADIVKELEQKFADEKIAIFSRIRNVSVAKLNAFRRELKKINAELKITKKTLMQRALTAANISIDPRKDLEGEVGIIFGYADEVAPAKLAHKFKKENETFAILLGAIGKKIITPGEVMSLARLPPRETLLAMLAGTLASPLRNFMRVLQGNQQNLVVVLNQLTKKLEPRK